MKHPVLFDVPPDPSRSRTRHLKEFKRKIGIWTHCTPFSTKDYPDYERWMAMLLPKNGKGEENYSDHRAYTKGSDEPMEIIAGYCRVIDDTGRCEYGKTEREAIKNLCDGLKIPFNP